MIRREEILNDPDVQAMERLAHGDDMALNEIMDRWTSRLGAFLTRYLGNQIDAINVTQDVFVAVYRNRNSYRPQSRYSTWIFGIAANLARQQLRWRRRHPEMPFSDEEQTPQPHDSNRDPARKMMSDERAAAVRDAVLGLPPRLREAILLSEFEQLPHRESAVILGCSTKAVETRVHRGKQRLRQQLQAWLPRRQ